MNQPWKKLMENIDNYYNFCTERPRIQVDKEHKMLCNEYQTKHTNLQRTEPIATLTKNRTTQH